MKVFFHIGPHKTGTTSIQAYLLNRFGSAEAACPLWYPEPRERGPGHARLAHQMNTGSLATEPNPLDAVVEAAREAAVDALILSSEDFVGAYPKRLPGYARALEQTDLVLLTTQNSLPNRIASLWQEMVKHGHPGEMAASTDAIFNRRGIRPGFLTAFTEALNPRQIAIIYSHPEDPPEALIHRVLAAMDLEPDEDGPDPAIRRNAGLGLIEVEVLRHLNEVLAVRAPHLKGERSRALRNALASSFRSNAWRRNCPRVDIEVPLEVKEAGRSAARKLAAEFSDLGRRWPVRVLGDPEALVTMTKPAEQVPPIAATEGTVGPPPRVEEHGHGR
jgi:hypothetical protein